MKISAEHLDQWRRDGYTLVERFLAAPELAAARADLDQVFPNWYVYSAAPHLFGSESMAGYSVEMPFLGPTANMVALHPDLIDFAERALGTREIVLTQSLAWAKYWSEHDFEQVMHADYMNCSILYPAASKPAEQVTMILYFDDLAPDLGPTCVVPRSATGDLTLVPALFPKTVDAGLYRIEKPILAPKGSLLLYDLRTLHRGTGITRPAGMRLTLHIMFRRADAPWVGYRAWANHGYYAELKEVVERSTIRQREVMGVPAPGHPYWNTETLTGMAMRYPAMDLEAYAAAAGVPASILQAARRRLRASPSQGPASATGASGAGDALRWQYRALRPYAPGLAFYLERMLNIQEVYGSSRQ